MKHRWIRIIGTALSIFLVAQTGRVPEAQTGQSSDAQNKRGAYAHIGFLRPHDGHTVDFEAGYIRHLQWHKQARDAWVWYGWNVSIGERQRWFVYATFGRSAASLDKPVSPAEDERDAVLNILPHCEFTGAGLYEYLPTLSRGTGEPQPTASLEFTTVDLVPGAAKAFEAAISASQSTLQGETLWYRMVAGGAAPRYVRLRPRASLSAILDGRSEQALPDVADQLVAKTSVEILSLRPTMSLGLEALSR
jgi:hypothetical protein